MIVNVLLVALMIATVIGILKFFKKKPEVSVENVKEVIQTNENKFRIEKIKKSKAYSKEHHSKGDFEFNILSITQNEDEIDVVVVFQNNSPSHVRIEITQVVFLQFQNNFKIFGSSELNDLTMGTNDIILKNTILSGGKLVRNLKWNGFHQYAFDERDTIEITFKVQEDTYTISNTIQNSTLDEIKYIIYI